MKTVYAFVLTLFMAGTAQAQAPAAATDRIQLADQKYEALFAAERTASPTDPEFMNILQNFIFGEVFYTGELDDKTRELITVVSLTTLQTLPQLKSHIAAALNTGNKLPEIQSLPTGEILKSSYLYDIKDK